MLRQLNAIRDICLLQLINIQTYFELLAVENGKRPSVELVVEVEQPLFLLARIHLLVNIAENFTDQCQGVRQEVSIFTGF